jgi:hypothetical protein
VLPVHVCNFLCWFEGMESGELFASIYDDVTVPGVKKEAEPEQAPADEEYLFCFRFLSFVVGLCEC